MGFLDGLCLQQGFSNSTSGFQQCGIQNDLVYPNAKACLLKLPVQVKTYDDFKRNMKPAFDMQEKGFGIVQ